MMKLLIAVSDADYVDHLSKVMTEKYADTFEVFVCTSAERLSEVITGKKFDAVLLDPEFATEVSASEIKLTIVLRSPDGYAVPVPASMERLDKYQRISTLVGGILDKYVRANPNADIGGDNGGQITAVWSPKGGAGKTTVALALAVQKVSQGRKTAYLSLQAFSDGAAFFPQTGKSISTIFGSRSGSIGLLAQSIRLQDQGSGLMYFCDPANYDDIYELTPEDVENLIRGCASGVDELVVDLPGEWNEKVSGAFDIADTVIAVIDGRNNTKWAKFISQHNTYDRIKGKLKLVANKGTKNTGFEIDISLPYVQSEDPIAVYKTLSAYF